MPSPVEVLITITGMGDPHSGDTDDWIKRLFPVAPFASHGDQRWIEPQSDRRIYLFEVRYEDVNDALDAKFQKISTLLPDATPDFIKQPLDEYIGDVAKNVLIGDSITASQLRFSNEYRRAIRLIGEVAPELDLRKARIGVVAHSLGTLVAYEGVYRVFNTPEIMMRPSEVTMVLCAPMLSPIYGVQKGTALDRYLTQFGCTRPKRSNVATSATVSNVRRCLGIYNTSDPFRVIQSKAFYTAQGADLMDEYIEYDSNPGIMKWKAHAMAESYLANNRDKIVEFLFS